MSLRTPPLRGLHADRGASFTDFGGWEMPVEFDSITTEHKAVRAAAGKFDVSHMGQIAVVGTDALALTGQLVTNDIKSLSVGDAQYAGITNEDGILLDDTLVYRLPDRDGTPAVLFIPNAGHDEKAEQRWIDARDRHEFDATITNKTADRGMIAVQGPEARKLIADEADDSNRVRSLGRFSAAYVDIAGVECWVARTGYTGEDGLELIFDAADAESVWEALDCQPCGLGSRDTLRTEAGFLLSGQDFDPEENPRTPFEAGISFAVDLDTEFVGRDALTAQQSAGVEETFVGIRLTERGVPRHGYEILVDDTVVGEITSGTMSPTLDEPIGLGYIDVEYSDPGTEVSVSVRGREKTAEIASPRFVDNT